MFPVSVSPTTHDGCSPHAPSCPPTVIWVPTVAVEVACSRERGLERAAWLQGRVT